MGAGGNVSRAGLEPATPGLKGRCSTVELSARRERSVTELAGARGKAHPRGVMAATLVRLRQVLDDEIEAVLAASEAEGLHFVRRVAREWWSGAHLFGGPGEALLGARDGSFLVGICGLSRDPYANDDRIGRLRNLYVLRSHRGRGIGSALASEVMRLAKETFAVLRLRASSAESA